MSGLAPANGASLMQSRQVLERASAVCVGMAGTTKLLRALCLWGVRALALAWLLIAPNTGAAAPASDDSVRKFVEQVNQASTGLVSSEKNADQRCRNLLDWAFDVPAMAQYALGKAWDKTSNTDREAFLAAFKDGIVAAYLRRMRDWRGATMSFVSMRRAAGGDRMAASRLSLPDAEETWIWRLRPSGQSWQIVDVAINGSSVLNTERQEYANIVAANHGDINAVITYIRQRIAAHGSSQ